MYVFNQGLNGFEKVRPGLRLGFEKNLGSISGFHFFKVEFLGFRFRNSNSKSLNYNFQITGKRIFSSIFGKF